MELTALRSMTEKVSTITLRLLAYPESRQDASWVGAWGEGGCYVCCVGGCAGDSAGGSDWGWGILGVREGGVNGMRFGEPLGVGLSVHFSH